MINNVAYWKMLKYMPLTGVLTELSFLENQIKCDEVMILNYFRTKFSGGMIREGYFKTIITPKKAVLVEGEIFEADIYFGSCSVYTGNNLQFKVNGQPLDIQSGFAHFKGNNETLGSKIKPKLFLQILLQVRKVREMVLLNTKFCQSAAAIANNRPLSI
jgi:hypothetical protein